MFNTNYTLLKFYFFSIFLLIFQTHSFATENHNFTLFGIKLGSNLSTVPNIKFINECNEIIPNKDICEFKIVYKAYFSPKNKSEIIDVYQVEFSPVSKKILEINGETKKFPTIDKCMEFNSDVIKVVSERLLNDNKGLGAHKDIYPLNAKFVLKEKDKEGRNISIKLYTGCFPDNLKKPQGPYKSTLYFRFDNDYFYLIQKPEMDNLIAPKKNEKEKKSRESGKFKNL
jgi:hypothetical protein